MTVGYDAIGSDEDREGHSETAELRPERAVPVLDAHPADIGLLQQLDRLVAGVLDVHPDESDLALERFAHRLERG